MLTAEKIQSEKLESKDIIWDLENGTFASKTEQGNKMVEAFASALLGRKLTDKDFRYKREYTKRCKRRHK